LIPNNGIEGKKMKTTLDNTQVKVSVRGTPLPKGKVASHAKAEDEDRHFVAVVDAVENEVETYREVESYEDVKENREEIGKELLEEMK